MRRLVIGIWSNHRTGRRFNDRVRQAAGCFTVVSAPVQIRYPRRLHPPPAPVICQQHDGDGNTVIADIARPADHTRLMPDRYALSVVFVVMIGPSLRIVGRMTICAGVSGHGLRNPAPNPGSNELPQNPTDDTPPCRPNAPKSGPNILLVLGRPDKADRIVITACCFVHWRAA